MTNSDNDLQRGWFIPATEEIEKYLNEWAIKDTGNV